MGAACMPKVSLKFNTQKISSASSGKGAQIWAFECEEPSASSHDPGSCWCTCFLKQVWKLAGPIVNFSKTKTKTRPTQEYSEWSTITTVFAWLKVPLVLGHYWVSNSSYLMFQMYFCLSHLFALFFDTTPHTVDAMLYPHAQHSAKVETIVCGLLFIQLAFHQEYLLFLCCVYHFPQDALLASELISATDLQPKQGADGLVFFL